MISIIIPTYNNAEELEKTLNCLMSQETDLAYEIIVVDNGSVDNTPEVVRRIGGDRMTLLFENEHPGSPYSARNRGIEAAADEAEVLVFLDATCTPDREWLHHGIEALNRTGADLVAGRVRFDLRSDATYAEKLDALTSVRMRDSVELRNSAYTANLFVKKSVVDNIGKFPEGLRSGGDVQWTYKATQNGCRLAYADRAVIWKKPRGFKSLARKKWRTGKALVKTWEEKGVRVHPLIFFLRVLKPHSFSHLRKLNRDREIPGFDKSIFILWLYSYFFKCLEGISTTISLLKRR